jgi:hypothetical protein
VAPGFFQFVFNPNKGPSSTGDSVSTYYPGKPYVGVVATDIYCNSSGWSDVSTYSWSTNDVLNLAVADGHDVAIPEFGATPGGNQGGWTGSGDVPAVVDSLFTWADTVVASGRNCFIVVWCDGWPSTSGTWGLNCFPKSFAEFKAQVTRRGL